MPRRTRALTVVAVVFVLGACGGDSADTSTASPSPTTEATSAEQIAAGDPSNPAKMVCEPDAVTSIATVIGTDATVSTPTWKDAVYSCDYGYPEGATMTLSVKELPSEEATTAYYEQLARDLGKKEDLASRGITLGQGAYTTSNGSVVTRKDNKVLLVDVSKLPANFGVPVDTRENDAINVAVTLMECWIGV